MCVSRNREAHINIFNSNYKNRYDIIILTHGVSVDYNSCQISRTFQHMACFIIKSKRMLCIEIHILITPEFGL